ncbi:MAG: YdcF family protein [Alphaproteobacteria bacterium]|nr:YdcF family protein [Alphaproteobacteria bacterium]
MKRLKFFCLISVLLIFLLWLGGFIMFDAYIRKSADTEQKTDAIVVLTGGKNRILEALKLYNNDMAEFLIISGVDSNVSLKELQKQNNIFLTKNDAHIILGKEATNTNQNAVEVSDAIRRNNIHSVRLVTSYYHMPRSKEEILAYNPDIEVVVHPVYSQNVSAKWWKKWNSFKLVASEFNKFLFVYVKYFTLRLIERN